MKAKGLGPRTAALYFGVNVRTVQRWLKGDRKVPGWLNIYITGAHLR